MGMAPVTAIDVPAMDAPGRGKAEAFAVHPATPARFAAFPPATSCYTFAVEIVVDDAGLYLPALDLHLDPNRPTSAAFISHAHADHIAGKDGACFVSPETRALLEARGVAHDAPNVRVIEWGGHVDVGTARLSIAPAGHVLGAAQLVVDHAGQRFVYTGDYRSGAGATHAAGAPVPCDELVVESTFALPIFRFPSRADVVGAVVAWCRARLDAGTTPVLLAYALGTSQEMIHHLLAAGLPVVAHGAAHRLPAVYEALGVPQGVADGRLRQYAETKRSKKTEGERAVVVVPPGADKAMFKSRGDVATGYVSGWALLDAPVDQRRADAAFAHSNHADYDDLVATVRACAPKKVWATHGFASPFARLLRAMGVDAHALDASGTDREEST
jgi:putative mRNA 3-end processing factor